MYAWGATNGTTIWYHPEKVQIETQGRAWDYVVAHERGHVEMFAAGRDDWTCEPCADDLAARYYPRDVRRWSPYR